MQTTNTAPTAVFAATVPAPKGPPEQPNPAPRSQGTPTSMQPGTRTPIPLLAVLCAIGAAWPGDGGSVVAPAAVPAAAQSQPQPEQPVKVVPTKPSRAFNRHVYRPPERKRDVYDGSELRRALDAYDRRYEPQYYRLDPALRRLDERRRNSKPAQTRDRTREREQATPRRGQAR